MLGPGSESVGCFAGVAKRIADREQCAPGAVGQQGLAGRGAVEVPQQEGALLQDQGAAAQSDQAERGRQDDDALGDLCARAGVRAGRSCGHLSGKSRGAGGRAVAAFGGSGQSGRGAPAAVAQGEADLERHLQVLGAARQNTRRYAAQSAGSLLRSDHATVEAAAHAARWLLRRQCGHGATAAAGYRFVSLRGLASLASAPPSGCAGGVPFVSTACFPGAGSSDAAAAALLLDLIVATSGQR